MPKYSHKKKILLSILSSALFLLIAAGGIGAYYYNVLLSPNVFTNNKKTVALNISEEDTTMANVINLLVENIEIKNPSTLKKAIEKLKYTTVQTGHYEIRNGMTNKELVRLLQLGMQTPVQVTFNNVRTKEQLASVLSKQLMPDSSEIMRVLNDTVFLYKYCLTTDNVLTVFIPNTYEFYWDTSAEKIVDRMFNEYSRFWNQERLAKAAAIPLTPIEVSILASIVEEETNKSYEYPIVAGLYINRLQKDMKLQADPTVKYAVGDFSLRRILNVHLKTESPYNTYKNKGLPPGPIRIPSIRVIDAVLDHEDHDYIFMAAKPNSSGEHNFARTLSEHNRYANQYRSMLNRRNIR